MSEGLRRYLGHKYLIENNVEIWESKIIDLVKIFSSHLETLKGMSRRYDDWVIDNILNTAPDLQLLTFKDSLNVLQNEFEIYNSSPNMFNDWRWYKSIYNSDAVFNEYAEEQYWQKVHNFIDYRSVKKDRKVEDNKELYVLCNEVRQITIKSIKGPNNSLETDARLIDILNIISENIRFSENTKAAIEEISITIKNNNYTKNSLAKLKNFKSWFGRGQQYMSYIKN